MSASIFGSAGAPGTQAKPFELTDDRERAFDILIMMVEEAQSLGLAEHVQAEVEQAILEEPNPDDAGATVASRAQYDILLKKAKDQKKDIATLMGKLRLLVSDGAWKRMLRLTTTSIFDTLNPRQVIRKFKEAFCALTGEELQNAQIVLQDTWVEGTSISEHVSKHTTAREQLEFGGSVSGQKEQVRALELSLRNLFKAGVHFDAKDAIAREHLPHAEAPNAFLAYGKIIFTRDRSGQFKNVTAPIAKVNAVKERSAGRAGSSISFLDRSKAAKAKHVSCSPDSNCPEHVNRNRSGTVHKWRDCSLYKGQGKSSRRSRKCCCL
jgi:hypothetical protein